MMIKWKYICQADGGEADPLNDIALAVRLSERVDLGINNG